MTSLLVPAGVHSAADQPGQTGRGILGAIVSGLVGVASVVGGIAAIATGVGETATATTGAASEADIGVPNYGRTFNVLIAGYLLTIAGGGWTGLWGVEYVLSRLGIHQAFGGFETGRARAEADARGKRHQDRMLAKLHLGLPIAIPFGVLGFVLLVWGAR